MLQRIGLITNNEAIDDIMAIFLRNPDALVVVYATVAKILSFWCVFLEFAFEVTEILMVPFSASISHTLNNALLLF